MKNENKCCVCHEKSTWNRITQFAGTHPFCDKHAKLEPDFKKETDGSTFVWVKAEGTVYEQIS